MRRRTRRVLRKLEPERCGGIFRKASIYSKSLMRLYSFKNSSKNVLQTHTQGLACLRHSGVVLAVWMQIYQGGNVVDMCDEPREVFGNTAAGFIPLFIYCFNDLNNVISTTPMSYYEISCARPLRLGNMYPYKIFSGRVSLRTSYFGHRYH